MSAARADRRPATRSVQPAASSSSAPAASSPAPEASASILSLSARSITIRKNGIEFLSARALTPWTELTVAIESSVEKRRVTCRGVVVDCRGSRHTGYQVSLLFLGLTPQLQARLESLALSHLG